MLRLVLGIALIVVGLANVILAARVGGDVLLFVVSAVSIVAGVVSVVRARLPRRDAPDGPRPTYIEPPVIELFRPRLGRGTLMTIGAATVIGGATWVRLGLLEDRLAIVPLVAAVVGAAVFLWAYIARITVYARPTGTDPWDRVIAWIAEHGALPALVALTTITAAMFGGVFVAETVGDDLTFHMAESARLADCLRVGDWDFWNPSANGGYASAYYYQVIPQLASALPAAVFGDHLFWFQLTLWLPQVAIPLAAYRGTRLLGAAPWQALCAAVAVTFVSGASRWGTGADGTFQVGLYTQTWALAAFPLGLGHGARYVLHGKGLAPAIAWGAFVFLCHPFASIGLCLGLAAGTLAHYLQREVRQPSVKLVLLALLGLAIVVNAIALILDPQLPDPSSPEAPWKPRYIYLAPLILLVGLCARVVTRGRPLRAILLAGVALALVGNAIAFAVHEAVPPRPEGATVDLPARWTLAGASLYLGPLLLLAALAGRLAWSLRRAPDGSSEAGRDTRAREPSAPPPTGRVLGFCLALATAGAALAVGLIVRDTAAMPLVLGCFAASGLGVAGAAVLAWPIRGEPVVRLVVLGAGLLVATAPGWLTLIIDREGFGGFPHRVSDEVGPGYQELARWYTTGALLDSKRFAVLTWSLPLVVAFARMRLARWLWAPAIVYATLLVLGPHAPKTDDDLLPAVRFLGALQIVLALAAGAGLYAVGAAIWQRAGRWQYATRTAVIALAVALAIFVGFGGRQVAARVNTLASFDYRDELVEMNAEIEKLPQGKKQVGPGAENHFWNLLGYVHARRPSLLQLGGGGLQASPNYDFLWSVRDFPKLAWVYDAPLFLFARSSTASAPTGEVLHQTARYELRRLPSPGIVSPVEITGVLPEGKSRAGSHVRKAAIEWLRGRAPLANQHVAYHGHGGSGPAPKATVRRAFRVDPSPGELADIYAEVDVDEPSTFVARESWHPRWRAFVDGTEVPVRRVTPEFLAIDVPAGHHVLAFRFERPWWAQAVWLLFPGVPLAIWAVGRRARRRPVRDTVA
jgi:hypothetical protein